MSDIGPQLPEHLKKKLMRGDISKEDDVDEQTKEELGPELDERSHDERPQAYGPSLPPAMSRTVGPSLPPDYCEQEVTESSSEDELIGPLPPSFGHTDGSESKNIKHEIEARAKAMKSKLTAKPEDNTPLKRETWMTELPPELSGSIGITARKFKTHTLSQSESDRSVWTDTPADRERKRKEKEKEKVTEPLPVLSSTKDKEIEKQVDEYNQRKRPMSLLEMHKEKKRKDGSSTENERKPFDRERDLAISSMDSKAKSNFIKKSKGLNTRFQEGKLEKKFL